MTGSYYTPGPCVPTVCCECLGQFKVPFTNSCFAAKARGMTSLWNGLVHFTEGLLSTAAVGAGNFSIALHYFRCPGKEDVAGVGFSTSLQHLMSDAPDGGVDLACGDGTVEHFAPDGSGGYSSAGNNTSAHLTRAGKGTPADTFTLVSRGGSVGTFFGTHPSIATPGRPSKLADRWGNTLNFSWSALGGHSRLTGVTDGYGRSSTLGYDAANGYRLSSVVDFDGRRVDLQYDSLNHLVAVVGPAITRGANSNANTFPYGTAKVFQYDVSNPRPERRDDLIAVYNPNEVAPYLASTRTVDVAGVYAHATPRKKISYYNDPTDPYHYGKVQQVTESASLSAGVGAGAWGFIYQDTSLPANLIDPSDPIVSRTIVTDRNGNQTTHDFDAAGMEVRREVFATRGKNSLQASSWVTWTKYNGHNQPLLVVLPEGNSVAYAYEDEHNTISFGGVPYGRRIGLTKTVTRLPGNTLGIPSRPGSGPAGAVQQQLTQRYFYDPLFGRVCASIEERGNPIDSSGTYFPPQNLGTTPTNADRSRYATLTFFDYQKDSTATVQADAALQGLLFPGLTSSAASADIGSLISFVNAQLTATDGSGGIPAGFTMGIGDVNGEGTGSGTSHNARHTGAVVKVQHPSVRQLAPTGSGTYPLTLQPDAPLAYWRLDETTGTAAADSTGHGNAATYTGGFTLGATGLLQNDTDKAVTLDGSSGYVAAGNPAAFQITTGSVEAWIKTSGAGSGYRGVITKQAAWGLYLLNNVLGAYDFSSGTFQSTGVNLADGNPHHVTFTFQAGVTNGSVIYIDGAAALTFTLGSSGLSQTTEVELGNGGPASGQTFAGTIDEAALYNTVLPAWRVLAHYTAGSSADPWAWQTQGIVELYTSNAVGQATTYTNPEGNLTVYVRYPQNNPDGNGDVDDPALSTQQYGRVKQTVVDADPSTVMTLVGSYGDMIAFTGNKITRTNTPGVYQSLTTTNQGTTGCTTCNYDPLGNVLTSVDARGNTTTYDRNELGEVYRVTSPAPYNFQVETSYDANRNVTQVDTQDWQVQYGSSDPTSPLYAQFTPTGSGSTANVPMQAGPGGSVRPGWFSNLHHYDLLDNKTQDDLDATGSTPSSLVTGYTFDFNQNLVKITKPLGNTVEFDYDERDLKIATRVGGASGPVTVMGYDGNGNLLDVIGPATRGTAAQTLSAIIGDAFGGSSNVTYSGDWVRQNSLDGFDRVTSATDAAGGVSSSTFDPGGRAIATQTSGSPGGPTPTDRSGSGNVPLASGSTRFDEAGRAYEDQQDVFLNTGLSGGSPTHALPSGRTVTHTGGGLAANSTANNHTAAVTLTAGGQSYVLRRSVFDRAGRTGVMAEDSGAQTAFAYDGADRQVSATDALGNVTSGAFDANGNVTAVTRTDACTIAQSIARESFGSLMYYDVLNQPVVRADQGADGTLTAYFPTPGSATIYSLFGYDSRGARTNLIDPKLNTTVFDFDGASRLLQTDQHLRTGGVGTTAIASTVSTYQAWDANSNLTKLTDANGGYTRFYFDALDRQSSMVFYDGSTRSYGYDLASDVTSYTDENGSVLAGTFDVLGRQIGVSVTPAAGVVGTTAQSFQFDGLSSLTFARDSVGSTNADCGFTRDSVSRVLEEQQTYSGDTRYVTHQAWTGYPSTGFTFPQGRQLTLGYDALYRKSNIQETSGGAAIASWQFFGGRTATVALGNGFVCSFMNNAQTRSAAQSGLSTPGWGSISTDQLGYDGAGRLIGKRYFNGSSVLVGFTSAYDKSSNKLFERPLHAESRASLYDSYDSMDRLLDYQRGTLASGGGSIATPIALPGTNQQQAYNLDALGNWSTTTITPEGSTASVQTRAHNRLNQLTAYGVSPASTPLYYDQGNNSGTPPQKGNGNIIDDGIRTYAYDAANRLNRVARKSDSLTIAEYVYDGLGRRVQKKVSNGGLAGNVPNGITRYLYEASRVIEEMGSSTTTTQYVWGQYIDELLQIRTYLPSGPQPLAAGSYYVLSDLLYRSSALTDSSCEVVEAYDIDAYGNPLLFGGSGATGDWFTDDDSRISYSVCRHLFTGRTYDFETALYFYRSRYYSPQLGRFLERDRAARLSANMYEYCLSAPSRYVDPAGTAPAVPPPPTPPAIVQPAVPSPAVLPQAPTTPGAGGLLSGTGRVPANPSSTASTASAEVTTETAAEVTEGAGTLAGVYVIASMTADAIEEGTRIEAETEMTCMNLQTEFSKPAPWGYIYARTQMKLRDSKPKKGETCEDIIKKYGGPPWMQLCSTIENDPVYTNYKYSDENEAKEALARSQNLHPNMLRRARNDAKNDRGPCMGAGLHSTYLKPGKKPYAGSVMCCPCCYTLPNGEPKVGERCTYSKTHD